MSCRDIVVLAARYRELSPEDRAMVDRHSASCGRCARALVAYMAQDYRLRNLPDVSPSSALSRAVMARTLDRRRPAPRLAWQLATAVAGLALVLGMAGAVTAAQGALPGEVLYPVKRGTEQVRLLLSPAAQRQELAAEFAQRRLDEVNQILESGATARVEFQGALESGSESEWLVEGLPVTIPAGSWPGEPPTEGSAVAISAVASGGELTANAVQVLEPAAPAEPGASATATGPGPRPSNTPGSYRPGAEPSFTPGAHGPGQMPAGTPGSYGPGAEPSFTPGAYGPAAQPTGTPGGYGPGGQPSSTPVAYGPGGEPTGTPASYGPGPSASVTPGGEGPGAEPTGTSGQNGLGPSGTPGPHGPGGQPSSTPGQYGPGPLPTGTQGGVGPTPTHSATAVGPGELPSTTPTGVGPGPVPDHTPTGLPPGPLPTGTPVAPGPGPFGQVTPAGRIVPDL